jgi:formylglycine-generating enzyme required for sulfatase activity
MIRCLACIAASLFVFMSHGEVTVSNVTVAQRVGTDLLDITYDLATSTSTNTVTVEISTNNGVAWFTPASGNMTGAVGENVSPGTKRTITWEGARELPPLLFPTVKANVTADDTPAQRYLVIDLSGGTNASSYPVSYLTTGPLGGWSDTYKTTKLVLRKIPKGTFTMGCRATDYPGATNSGLHTVTLTKDFYIGVFEVTQRQWELVMGNKPSTFYNATYYASRPVENVSYYDIREKPTNSNDTAVDWPNNSKVNAASFMGKLRAKTGLSTFDLPTESQWEYACRGGAATALNSGYNLTNVVSDSRMDVAGRYYRNGGSGFSQNCSTNAGTAKVGSYLPNAWGLYDMHGNVWEWCLDWYGTYPGTVNDPAGAVSGSYRVYRGGSWGDDAYFCCSAFRAYIEEGFRYPHFGFRAASTLP